MEEEEEDLITYEDELYLDDSEASDSDNDIADRLYEQAHYSSNLQLVSKISDITEEEKSLKEDSNELFPEILVEEPPALILGTENEKKSKKKVLHAVTGEDGEQWDVDDVDLGELSKQSSKRYYDDGSSSLPNIFCYNCDQKGHLQRNCTQPKKIPSCYLCGQFGHHRNACPNDLCYNCLAPGHISKDCTEPYVKHWQLARQRCTRCKRFGHRRKTCPEVWRQYHLTTVADTILKPYDPNLANKKKFCYNCGSKRHFGEDCEEERYCRRTVYSQFVVSYDKCIAASENQKTKSDFRNTVAEKENKKTLREMKTSRKEKNKISDKRTDEENYIVLEEWSEAETTTKKKDKKHKEKESKESSKEQISSNERHNEIPDKQTEEGDYIVLEEWSEADIPTKKKDKKLREKENKESSKEMKSSCRGNNEIPDKQTDEEDYIVLEEWSEADTTTKKTSKKLEKEKDSNSKRKTDKKRNNDDEISNEESTFISNCKKMLSKKRKASSVEDTSQGDNPVENKSKKSKLCSIRENLDFIPLAENDVIKQKSTIERSNEKKSSSEEKNSKKRANDSNTDSDKQKKNKKKKGKNAAKSEKNKEYDLDYMTLHNLRKILTDSEDDECDLRTQIASQRSSPDINIQDEEDDEEVQVIEKNQNSEDLRLSLNKINKSTMLNSEIVVDLSRYDPQSVYEEHLAAYGLITVNDSVKNAKNNHIRWPTDNSEENGDVRVINVSGNSPAVRNSRSSAFDMSNELQLDGQLGGNLKKNFNWQTNRDNTAVVARNSPYSAANPDYAILNVLKRHPHWKRSVFKDFQDIFPNWKEMEKDTSQDVDVKNQTKKKKKRLRKVVEEERSKQQVYPETSSAEVSASKKHNSKSGGRSSQPKPNKIPVVKQQTTIQKSKQKSTNNKRGFVSRLVKGKKKNSNYLPGIDNRTKFSFLPGIG